jgi:branched-chain amino acid transport system substrate-binding protein
LADFRKSFKGDVAEILVKQGSMEFTAALNEIRKDNADAVYLLLSGGMAVDFLTQYSAAGMKQQLPLFAPGDLFDHTVLAAAAPAPVNMFSVGIWSEDLDSPANKRLETDFETDFGRPVSGRAAAGYDAAMLIDAAIRGVDRKLADVELLRAAMKRVDFPSTRGYFRFDNNQFPVLNFWVRQVAADQRGRMVSEQRGLLQGAVHDPIARECPMKAAPEPAKPK